MGLTKSTSIDKLLLPICLSILLSSYNYAQKEDIVILYNNSNIIGEIEHLELGKLFFKTDDMETINIKWDKVKSLPTKNIYKIELQDGRTYYGSISPGEADNSLQIDSDTTNIRLLMKFIVNITRIKESFWDILDGYVRLGFSFTKASGLGQLSFGFNGNYITKIFYAELNANSVITTTNDKPTSRKQDISFIYRKYMRNKWFWGAVLGAEENTQLGIQLRILLGGGIGHILIQTNNNWFYGLAGITVNREWYRDSTNSRNNIEGLLNGEYRIFFYDYPKANLHASLNIFPSLTNFGRIRSDLNVNLNWEIFSDFFWVLSFYLNYDNKPTSNASQSDYRFETSFKYEL